MSSLPVDFESIASSILRKDISKSSPTLRDRLFRSIFGTSSVVCSVLWEYLRRYGTVERKKIKQKHLLWSLMFLKLYANEECHASLAGCDQKTFRKWIWIVLKDIQRLEPRLVSPAFFTIKLYNLLHLFYKYFLI